MRLFTISTKAMGSYFLSSSSSTNSFLLTQSAQIVTPSVCVRTYPTRLRTSSLHIPTKSFSSSSYIYSHKPFSSTHHSLFIINSPLISHRNYLRRRDLSVRSSAQGSPGNPSKSWKTWIAGLLISIFTLPFWKNKLNPFIQLKNEIETIVEEAEIVAEVVEKVAEEVVEIADALDKKLPEGGKLKDGVEFIENAAKEIVKDANIAEDVLHKVEEIEKEVDSIIQPVINQMNVGVDNQSKVD